MEPLSRRRFIARFAAGGFALTALPACSGQRWPEGMAAIDWGHDTCARCRMVISKRSFAAEARGGPRDEVLKFDDIGCVVHWLKNQDWRSSARIWVADAGSSGNTVAWLDARTAHYVQGIRSPMGYDFAAFPTAREGTRSFEEVSSLVLAKGR